MAGRLASAAVAALVYVHSPSYTVAQDACATFVTQDTCKNGGSCVVSSANLPVCQCAAGYSGDTCETEDDPWLVWIIVSAVVIGLLLVALVIGIIVLCTMRRRRRRREYEKRHIIRTNYLDSYSPKRSRTEFNPYMHVMNGAPRAYSEIRESPRRLEVPQDQYYSHSLPRTYVNPPPPVAMPIGPIAQQPPMPIMPAQPTGYPSHMGTPNIPPGKTFVPTQPQIDGGPGWQHIGYLMD